MIIILVKKVKTRTILEIFAYNILLLFLIEITFATKRGFDE